MLDQGCDLADLDAITLESQPQLNVLHEAIKVIALETICLLLQKGFHVRKVDQRVFHPELHLEQVQDECVWVSIRVVHVRLNSFREVVASDILSAVHSSLKVVEIPKETRFKYGETKFGRTYIVGSTEQVVTFKFTEIAAAHAHQMVDLVDTNHPVCIFGCTIPVGHAAHGA